uniref:Phosphodiesterase n=1 Tax=Sinocyclocheilus anshuiensis TaxID=1608454 RepID=A0A671KHB4_9TELE
MPFTLCFVSSLLRHWMHGCVERPQAGQTLITEPRSRLTILGRRRVSHPLCGPSRGHVHPATMERPHSCLSVHQIDDPVCLDRAGGRSPRSLQSTYFPFSPCVSRSKCLPHSLNSPRPAGQCKRGESCNFMMRLFGGLIRPLQNKIICQILQHLSEITQAQRCCLSMTTVDKTGVKCLGPLFQSDEESVYGYTQAEWDKCIMGYVVSTGRPLNISDAREVINEGCSVSSLIWPHSQFRSLVLLELAQLVSHDYPSVDDMLSKLAAVILPITKAQFCTVFISDDSSTVVQELIKFMDNDSLLKQKGCCICLLVTLKQHTHSFFFLHFLRIGVCQLVNKMAFTETEVFSRADEHLLEDFAVYCALGLQKFNAQQRADKTRVLSYQISASQEEIDALEEAVIPSADALRLLDFGFSDFDMSQIAMTQAVVRMFLDLNLPQDFSVDYKTLCQWVLSVQKCYRSNVVYHNWSHALRTAQCMFAMLKLLSNLSSLEVLALMIASLCHDLDHRGVNNSYIERSNQPLAQLYGHSSLEHHHYDMCLLILNNPDSQMLRSLSLNEYRACVQMIEKNILATDLAIYIEKRTKFFKLAQSNSCLWTDEGHRELLRSVLMTASDICAITKPWPVQKRIAELVATELYAQGDREKYELNIQPMVICTVSVFFLLFQALASICESWSPLKEGCRRNRKHWQQLAQKHSFLGELSL